MDSETYKKILIAFGSALIIILLIWNIHPKPESYHQPVKHQVKTQETLEEVYCIGEDIYRYQEAIEECEKRGGRIATEEDVADAYSKGAHWCNLGWVDGMKAFYPMQTTIPGGKCGKKGLNGGRLPTQLKLGAICYGIKPTQKRAPDVLAWDTRVNKWNMD